MKQLNPKAVWLFFISLILRWLIVLIFIGFWMMGFFGVFSGGGLSLMGFLGGLGVIVIALLILLWIWAKLSYHFYRYELREDGFRKELGVIRKKYVTIPYDRIQNVDIHRGIIARLLGLSDLNIQTAGASATYSRRGMHGFGAEGRLPGVSHEIAEQLRDELVRRSRQHRTTNRGL